MDLPDLFRLADGRRVLTPDDWRRRRLELAELIQTHQYGHLPPAPPAHAWQIAPAPDYMPPPRNASNADVASPSPDADLPPRVALKLSLPDSGLSLHLLLTIPVGPGPFAVVIRGDLCWGPVKPPIATELQRRGYMLADFDRTEIAPDDANRRNQGLWAMHPGADFGALAAWAWGYHRVIDYLLRRRDVDPRRIIVTGHSRGGKAALLAGALDERIALTVPNNSGCGGAGCYRFQGPGSETLAAIVERFPHWFDRHFGRYAGQEERLPFDQHFLKALVAPRALLTTEALDDHWGNPSGSSVTHEAAKAAFAFLHAHDRIAIRFRPGIHEQSLEDWRMLLDFAGKQGSRVRGEG